MDRNNYYEYNEGVKIEDVLKNEKVLWTLKPNKKAYMYGRVIENELFSIIFIEIMLIVVLGAFYSFKVVKFNFVFIMFMIINIIMLCKAWSECNEFKKLWKCDEYCITEKRIILKTGNNPMEISSFYYDNINEIVLENGFIKSFFGVGNIVIKEYSNNEEDEEGKIYPKMYYIDRPFDVYSHLQKFLTERKETNKKNKNNDK